MTDPRIGAFARWASGDVKPVRVIEGQATKLTRVAHGIAYDAAHDEIVASEPLASSVVVFPGGAHGEVAPSRVIQGPLTQLHQPWAVAVDDTHNELTVADYATSSILVYKLDANGNVAPLRVIGGPKTGMRGLSGVAVDPKQNLIVGATFFRRTSGLSGAGPYSSHFQSGSEVPTGGLFVFNRTDNGDVAPRGVIAGPHTGLIGSTAVAVYGGKIYAVAANFVYTPPYDLGGYAPRKGCTHPPLSPYVEGTDNPFIGVWRITDHGDVPPMAVIHGESTAMIGPTGIALNPKDGEIYVADGGFSGVLSYLVPSFF